MPKILITGANSFVGTNFIKYSRYKDIDQVSLIDKKPEEIDFRNYDVVLHLAAIVHQSKKISDEEYFKINRDLCIKVAEKARGNGIKHFIFISTLKVYGKNISQDNLRNEESECFPDDAYGRSKLAAEFGLKQLESPDFIITVVRTPLVYGAGVKANMLKLIKLVKIFPILPLGNINNKRNFTYIENLVSYIDRIIERRASGTFIAMDENAVSTTKLIEYISNSMGKKVVLISLPTKIRKLISRYFKGLYERLFDSLEVDNDRTLKFLDYKPPFKTDDGIRRMIQQLKQSKNNEL